MRAINGSGAFGIGFSVVVVIIAALNLVLDFDFIENGARSGAPKYMEYAAFALMVTLVWLYLETCACYRKSTAGISGVENPPRIVIPKRSIFARGICCFAAGCKQIPRR